MWKRERKKFYSYRTVPGVNLGVVIGQFGRDSGGVKCSLQPSILLNIPGSTIACKLETPFAPVLCTSFVLVLITHVDSIFTDYFSAQSHTRKRNIQYTV